MRITISQAGKTFNQALGDLSRFRQNADAYQKICQIAVAILEGINWYYSKNFLPKLIAFLDIANVHDFYEIVKLPSMWSFPITAKRVDEYALRDSFSQLVKNSPVDVKQLLNEFLTYLSEKDIAFRNKQAFREGLKQFCNRHRIPVDGLVLNHLKCPLKQVSLFEIVGMFHSSLASVICIPTFLHDWDVISFASISNQLGQNSYTKWMTNYPLDLWLRGCLCVGFLFQFFEAIRILCVSHSKREKEIATWNLFASGTEFIFNFSLFKHYDHHIIILTTFVAKTIGLVSILHIPKPLFFDKELKCL